MGQTSARRGEGKEGKGVFTLTADILRPNRGQLSITVNILQAFCDREICLKAPEFHDFGVKIS